MKSKHLVWLILAGFPVLLWWHLSSLLARPYYQFVIVVPVLVLALVRGREGQESGHGDFRRAGLVAGALAFALALLGLATWKWSPWGGMLACLIASFAALWFQTGWSGMSRWFSAWVMCWILLPLPFGWDERLTVGLRGITTKLTSRVLDQFGTLHVSYMNVIQIPAKSLFIADACSGVHSLYVLLAASLFWGLYNRRTVFHTILLVFGAFGVVLFENIARLVVIVMALGWKMDLSAGTNHFLLGMFLFALSAGLIVSFDRLLLFLLPGRLVKKDDLAKNQTQKQIDSVANKIPVGIQFGMPVLASLYLICGGAQWVLKPGTLPDLSVSFRSPPSLPEFGEEAVPTEIAGFSRIEYKHIQRVLGDPFGQESQQWLYGREPLLVQVSIDYPYDGYHDPRLCYSQIGWQIVGAEVITPKPRSEAAVDAPIVLVRMTRPLEGDAVLMFSQVDWNGRVTARLPDHDASLKHRDVENRVRSFLARSSAPTEPPPVLPLTQFQLLARSAEAMTPEQIERMVNFYHEFRRHTFDRIRQEQTGSATPTAATPTVDAAAQTPRQQGATEEKHSHSSKNRTG